MLDAFKELEKEQNQSTNSGSGTKRVFEDDNSSSSYDHNSSKRSKNE